MATVSRIRRNNTDKSLLRSVLLFFFNQQIVSIFLKSQRRKGFEPEYRFRNKDVSSRAFAGATPEREIIENQISIP